MKLLLSLILVFFLLSPSLALAGLDEGSEMVSQGIQKAPQNWADEALENQWGVTRANLTDDVNLTPSAKLVNSIAAAEQHPESLEWVQEELRQDYKTYIIIGLIIIVWAAGFVFWQKIKPEEAGEFTEFFSGSKHFIGFAQYYKTVLLLILLPSILPYVFDLSIELEQAWSSGIMANSLQFISFSVENAPLYFYQGVAYSICGPFFLGRIILINQIYAKTLFVSLALAIPQKFIRYLGIGVFCFFESLLFVRPLILLVNAKIVQTVAEMPITEAVVAAPDYYFLMLVISFILIVVALLWPAVYVIFLLLTSKPVRHGMKLVKGF